MDYAREELLRQGRILTALLLRERPARQEEAASSSERGEAAPGEFSRQASPAVDPLGTIPANGVPPVGQTTAATIDGEAGAGTGGRTVSRTAAGDPVLSVSRRARRSRPLSGRRTTVEGETVTEWLFPGSSAASAGGTDARAVSRAVQRDARRYDGGFTIY